MSFLLRLADKFRKIISNDEIPKAEEYHATKGKNEDDTQFPTIEIESTIPPVYKSRPRNSQPEHMKYTKSRKITKDYVVIDFETTGLSQFDSEIIQIGAVKYNDLTVVDQYTTLVNPKTEISSKITRITGIKNEDVIDAPLIQDVLPELVNFIGDYELVAHNAPFDMKFLLYNMNNTEIPYKRFRVHDTLSFARKHIPTNNHKLVTLKKHLQLDHYASHDALDDCFVAGEVYKHCYNLEINPPTLTFEDPENYESFQLYEIGMRLYNNKQLKDAEKYLLASIEKGNDAPAVYERLGIVYRKQKRYQDEIDISVLGKSEVGKTQGTKTDEMFNTRINRAKELLEKQKVNLRSETDE